MRHFFATPPTPCPYLPERMERKVVTLLSGYIPFLSPLQGLEEGWYLLAVPLAFLISMSHKAMKVRHFQRYWRKCCIMTVQVLLGMITLAVTLLIIVQWVVPRLPVE